MSSNNCIKACWFAHEWTKSLLAIAHRFAMLRYSIQLRHLKRFQLIILLNLLPSIKLWGRDYCIEHVIQSCQSHRERIRGEDQRLRGFCSLSVTWHNLSFESIQRYEGFTFFPLGHGSWDCNRKLRVRSKSTSLLLFSDVQPIYQHKTDPLTLAKLHFCPIKPIHSNL